MTSKRIVRFGLLIAWLALTVFLSRQSGTGSAELSFCISKKVITIFSLEIPTRTINIIIRESAHFFVHMGLGFLAFRAFITVVNFKPSICISLLICEVIAVFDEFVQRYVPGRVWDPYDIVMNSLGICLGIIIGILLTKNPPK